MEASVIEQPPTEAPAEDPQAPPYSADTGKFSKWSEFIDIGPDAESCPDHGADCNTPGHFHAWVRLPNPLQHRDIRERALAAQARKTRLLRDEESNAGVVMESELDEFRAKEDKAPVVEALVGRDFARDYGRAVTEVQGREDSPYERVAYDQERLYVLEAKPEDERGEEFEELQKHLTRYAEEVKVALEAERAPKREALTARDLDDLLVEYRAMRVEQDAMEEYLHVYGIWEVVCCAFHPKLGATTSRPEKRIWGDVEDLNAESGETIDALTTLLDELRAAQQKAVMGGNS